MPQQKDLKRLIRRRMKKTGESYTTARTHLLESNAPPAPSRDGAEAYASLAGMSDAAVSERTGRTWREWVEHLDGEGAESWPHPRIARYLGDVFALSGWWSQSVTVGYERIKGLREIGQRGGGTYEVNKSKTVPVPVERLFEAFENESVRARWLPDVEWQLRKSTACRSMRITWWDGTSVEAYFTKKGGSKSAVQIQHVKLPSKSDAEKRKRFWGERLQSLDALLRGQ